MTEETIVKNRLNEGEEKYSFRLILFGSLLYAIHFLWDVVAIIIGLLKPNVTLYSLHQSSEITANYLFPWIVLSYEPYSQYSLSIGIISIIFEISAIVLFTIGFLRIQRNHNQAVGNIPKIIIILLIFTFFIKYVVTYILLFTIWTKYAYPRKIYFMYLNDDGFILFYTILLSIFVLQLAIILLTSSCYVKIHRNTEIKLKPIFTSTFILLLFVSTVSCLNISYISAGFLQDKLELMNVLPSLEWMDSYKPLLILSLVLNSLYAVMQMTNILIIRKAK